MNFSAVQQYMRDERIDGWLVYDFRGSNAVFARLLPGPRHTTRRAYLFIPAQGEPTILHSIIDDYCFKDLSLRARRFVSWGELQDALRGTLAGCGRVAMEYAAGGNLPVVSIVDGGTVEYVRSLGVEVVSSANIIQVCIARWSPEAVKVHAVSSQKVAAAKDMAFDLIRQKHAARQTIHEHEVQAAIVAAFDRDGLEYPDPPIVAVNAHAGDPHYSPSADQPTPIRPGDWVLIDLWARVRGDDNIYSDITWVGFCGRDVPAKHRAVFNVVKAARDASLRRAQEAWQRKERVCGYQLDDAARDEIFKAGYGDYVRHRTGHSLSAGTMVHGIGVNLDNLETHDARELIPGVGFTIEPGIYLPEFGVRLEINVYADPQRGPIVTSCLQDEPVLIA